jgi:hypothetical protein
MTTSIDVGSHESQKSSPSSEDRYRMRFKEFLINEADPMMGGGGMMPPPPGMGGGGMGGMPPGPGGMPPMGGGAPGMPPMGGAPPMGGGGGAPGMDPMGGPPGMGGGMGGGPQPQLNVKMKVTDVWTALEEILGSDDKQKDSSKKKDDVLQGSPAKRPFLQS